MASVNLLEELYKAKQNSNRNETADDGSELKELVRDTRNHLAEYYANDLSHSILDIANRHKVAEAINGYITSQAVSVHGLTYEELLSYLEKEICGFGPLEPLLEDDAVSEIMVNGINEVYIEKGGKLYLTQTKFTDEEQLINIVRKILAPIGRNLDLTDPYVDARLPGGSRINAVIAPVALNGTTVTIRKFARVDFTQAELISNGTLTSEMVQLLKVLIKGRANILVVGGTGSGKTSLLKFVGNCIENERIITIEDVEELRLKATTNNGHIISLEARRSKENPITIYDLLVNALRMRPDRIIVGEVRGKEALEMLEAMNTGHEGSLSTLHANGPKEALKRLALMILRAGLDLEINLINEMIADTIDVILFMRRMPEDGSRKLVQISEVVECRQGGIVLNDLVRFHRQGVKENEVYGTFQFHQPMSEHLRHKLMTWGITSQELQFSVRACKRRLESCM